MELMHVLKLVGDFADAGKLVAAICHGGWIPISARVYQGVRVTGSPGIKDVLVNAGGTCVMVSMNSIGLPAMVARLRAMAPTSAA